MAEFLAMGGYAAYVWPAYGMAALGLAGITLATWRGLARARRAADKEE
jgi:heme exporter protein D